MDGSILETSLEIKQKRQKKSRFMRSRLPAKLSTDRRTSTNGCRAGTGNSVELIKKLNVCGKPTQSKEGSSSYSDEDISAMQGWQAAYIQPLIYISENWQEHKHFEIIFKDGVCSIHCKDVYIRDAKRGCKNQRVILSNWM